MANSQEKLNALVSDIAERADICKNTVVRFIAVGVKSMHSDVSMPVATAITDQKVRG